MISASMINVTVLFAAILGVLHVVFALRVGLYRAKTRISVGDGGDKELRKRMRGHGNFIENAPIALVLLLLNELNGLASGYLYALGSAFVIARIAHYAALVFSLNVLIRMTGMMFTLGSILVMALLLLF